MSYQFIDLFAGIGGFRQGLSCLWIIYFGMNNAWLNLLKI